LDTANNDDGGGYAISETCDEIYEQAARCEKNVKGIQWQDNSSCELIHKTIPKLSAALGGLSSTSVSKIFAWMFGIALVFMGWYIYRLHKILGKSAEANSFNLMPGTVA
jgi:hypothetical protein